MFTTRVLPPSEYPKLAGTEAETIWPLLTEAAQVLVVERGEQIVGCWVLMPVLHAECLWIAPEARRSGAVGRRLWTAMRAAVTGAGSHAVMTAAVSDEVRALLDKVGATRVPGDHFIMPFQEPKTCQP
jgi:hypothetical protein